jgi:serine protease Do
MKIKIFGICLAIASFLSLGLVSCSNPDRQTNSSNPQDATESQTQDRSPTVAVNIGEGESTPQAVNFGSATDEQRRIKLFEKSKDAVVKIRTTGGTGSGFIITNDGLVVTNTHVVKNDESQVSEKVKVTLADGTELAANVLGRSRYQDLALIRIPNQSKLKSLKLAKPESLRVGQNVYAIGSPFGIDNTFTAGILNKIDKAESVLLHDARINSGNSGGPLIDSRGEVIGVNTSIYARDRQGSSVKNTAIGVAISVDRVNEMVAAYKGKLPNFISIDRIDKRTKSRELLTNGTAIASSFKSGDDIDNRNIYYHDYSFRGKANQQFSIEMSSDRVDPVLVIYFVGEGAEPKKIYENNDISPTNTNAKISIVLPQDGVYIVKAKTFQPGETGAYQIKANLQ